MYVVFGTISASLFSKQWYFYNVILHSKDIQVQEVKIMAFVN